MVVEAFILNAGVRSYTKSRDRWEFNDLPLLRSHHVNNPNDSRSVGFVWWLLCG